MKASWALSRTLPVVKISSLSAPSSRVMYKPCVCGTSLEKHAMWHITQVSATAMCDTSVQAFRFDNNRPSTHRNSTNMSVVHANQTKRCQSGSRPEHSHTVIAPRRLCISCSNCTSRCPIDGMLPLRCSSVKARSCSSSGRRLSRMRSSKPSSCYHHLAIFDRVGVQLWRAKKSHFQPSVEMGMKKVDKNIDERNKQRFG